MSKLDEYLSEKSKHFSMVNSIEKALNTGSARDERRDKHNLCLSTSQWHDEGHKFYLYGYSGFWGSSSCYYECPERFAQYFRKVINDMMPDIAKKVFELSELDVRIKLKEAEEQAKGILKDIELDTTWTEQGSNR